MSDTSGYPRMLIPDQPAQIVVGGKRVPVDGWSLAGYAQENNYDRVVRENQNLTIGPRSRFRASLMFGALFPVFGAMLGLVLVIYTTLPEWLAGVTSLGVLGLFIWYIRSTISSSRWIRFDRVLNQLVIEKRIGFRGRLRVEQTYPLASIVAVQLLHNGRHSVTVTQGAEDQQTTHFREFYAYELNLVLDQESERRINLWSVSDWKWILATGQAIGEFLQVPVIDKLYHGA